MKLSDYISVGMIAVVGTILAYFLMNSILGDPKEKTISFEYIDAVTADLKAPDSEIFNAGAINPTVEVYVGSCRDLDNDGRISDRELIECGQATPTTSTGETVVEEDTYNSMTDEENEAINRENGYASGTSAEQRNAVENQINEFQNQQNSSSADNVNWNDPARQETVSGN
ncbi:hypothetical protein IJ380_00130 [Candidatus Saccharibacteria bacterium]|nr:hypothetical protein [Candidatus Saccharibacteria bacterium]